MKIKFEIIKPVYFLIPSLFICITKDSEYNNGFGINWLCFALSINFVK